MNKQNEENAVYTEFSKQFEDFAKKMKDEINGNPKKGFIMLALDQSVEPNNELSIATIGSGKLLIELLMCAMASNEALRRIFELSVKGHALYSMCKNVLNIEK